MPFPVFAGSRITSEVMNSLRTRMVAQSANIELVNAGIFDDSGATDNSVATEVFVPLEVGAIYDYTAVITYSATVNSDFGWRWDVPTGTSMPRQTASYSLLDTGNTAVNDGGNIILRSPAATTRIRAKGTDGAGTTPVNFHCVLEYGSIQVGGTPGHANLRVGQWISHADTTILRGIQRTRVFYKRVQ